MRVHYLWIFRRTLAILELYLKTIFFKTYHLWVTLNQVWPLGEWVWDAGKEDGRGEGGMCRSCPCRAERTESPTSPHSGAQSAKENVTVNLTWHSYLYQVTDRTSTSIIILYLQEASLSADVSMDFSGKLTTVVLLVLLAAQGKTRRAVDRCA